MFLKNFKPLVLGGFRANPIRGLPNNIRPIHTNIPVYNLDSEPYTDHMGFSGLELFIFTLLECYASVIAECKPSMTMTLITSANLGRKVVQTAKVRIGFFWLIESVFGL